MGNLLDHHFFNRDAALVARKLLGKILRHRYLGDWLSIQIIENGNLLHS